MRNNSFIRRNFCFPRFFIYLFVLCFCLQISQGKEIVFLTKVKTLEDILSHPFYLTMALISLLMMAVVPFCHMYFWLVVASLRKRMLMEIAIDFNSAARVVSREEAQKQMELAIVAQHRLQAFELKSTDLHSWVEKRTKICVHISRWLLCALPGFKVLAMPL